MDGRGWRAGRGRVRCADLVQAVSRNRCQLGLIPERRLALEGLGLRLQHRRRRRITAEVDPGVWRPRRPLCRRPPLLPSPAATDVLEHEVFLRPLGEPGLLRAATCWSSEVPSCPHGPQPGPRGRNHPVPRGRPPLSRLRRMARGPRRPPRAADPRATRAALRRRRDAAALGPSRRAARPAREVRARADVQARLRRLGEPDRAHPPRSRPSPGGAARAPGRRLPAPPRDLHPRPAAVIEPLTRAPPTLRYLTFFSPTR